MIIRAAVDTETTGLVPHFHEMIELGILPMDKDFNPHPTIKPFVLRVKANFPERMEEKVKKINGLNPLDGLPKDEAIATLDRWMADNDITQLEILTNNGHFDRGMIFAFNPTFSFTKLHYALHDTRAVASALHDALGIFPHGTSLTKVASYFGVSTVGAHGALADCEITRQVYIKELEMLRRIGK